jgi:hypothetical protein
MVGTWRSAAACVAVACGALLAMAAETTQATGTLGSTIRITGLAFKPSKKTRVQLVPHPGLAQEDFATLRTSVRPAAIDALDAQVLTARAGVYDIVVTQRKHGAQPVTLPGTFTIVTPEPLAMDPVMGPASTISIKRTTTVVGHNFGPHAKKDRKIDRVTIGGADAKVLAWKDDAILVEVPRDLAVGMQTVVVTNRIGTTASEFPYTITPPDEPVEFLRASMGGAPFEILERSATGFVATYDAAADHVRIYSNTRRFQYALDVDFAQLATPTPFIVSTQPDSSKRSFRATYFEQNGGYRSSTKTCFLAVTQSHHGIFEGSFTGQVEDGDGNPGVGTCSFRVHLDPAP